MFKNISTTFASNFINALLNLLIAVVISQFLGAEGKGEQSIIITNISIILLINNIIGGATIVYLVPRFDNKKILLFSYLWAIVICSFTFIVSLVVSDISIQYLIHICVLTFISSLASANMMILLGKEKIISKNIVTIIQIAITVIFLLIFMFVLNIKDIKSYIYSLYIGCSMSLIFSIILLDKHWNAGQKIDNQGKSLISSMFRLGFVNQLSHITQMMSFRLSFYLLLIMINKDSVGIYSVAVAIVESVWLITKSIAVVQYARITNSTDENYNIQLTVNLLKTSLVMCFIMIIVLSALPVSFFRLMFGAEFGNVKYLILIMIPGVFFYNFALILGHYFSGKGKYYINTISSVIGLAVTIILCLILIPKYGYYGTAIAASISFLTTAFYVFLKFKKTSGFKTSSFFPNKEDIKNYYSTIWEIICSKRK
ncbi:MAG: polysaccharide biosynthesis C-terminal domain-containing protein [Bacteroidetes bacterium]|nr:polysaccharide biosynthesis C-terminal domain-containing protein [Bacteroidota bacterium]